jgi:hypothetical protein
LHTMSVYHESHALTSLLFQASVKDLRKVEIS